MLPPRSINIFKGISRLAYATLRVSRATAWGLTSSLVALATIGDLLTGNEIWFGPVYLFVLCIATWLLGWGVGHAIGILCMIVAFIINGASLYPYASSALSLDLALRFVAMSIILSAIAAVRGAYMREWWLARIEPMTGALNRQAFFEFGEIICGTRDWRLLMFADLDGFKAINDGLGHAAGDQCLKHFAATVRASIRKDDLFARMGGDEFIVFMAVKDEAAGPAVAARLHEAMNNAPSTIEGGVKCSVGALVVPPCDATLDDLVRQADALMYRAKARGACLEIGQADPLVPQKSAGRARKVRRPTLLADAPVPKFPYERRASFNRR